jgi:glycine/D-amino acid oxidase-like deaminating enzyme
VCGTADRQVISRSTGHLHRPKRCFRRVYVATGCGNGITFGTLAGMMLRDACLDVANPMQSCGDPRQAARLIKSF